MQATHETLVLTTRHLLLCCSLFSTSVSSKISSTHCHPSKCIFPGKATGKGQSVDEMTAATLISCEGRVCVCVSGAALRQFSQQEKTAEHSAQSLSWEEGRQEDAQPGDSRPLHPRRPFPVYGPGTGLSGPRGRCLDRFLTPPDLVTRHWCFAWSPPGSACPAHRAVTFYGSA